ARGMSVIAPFTCSGCPGSGSTWRPPSSNESAAILTLEAWPAAARCMGVPAASGGAPEMRQTPPCSWHLTKGLTLSNARYLTKSRFALALECPTKLFYTGKTRQYANKKLDDEFLAALAEVGFQVGELAK